MAYSQADLVQLIRYLLQDTPWETTNTSDPGAAGTTFTVGDGARWDEGAVGEFQDNGEQVWVRSVSGTTLTVKRGHNSTTAQAHASGIVLYRDPVFPYVNITEGIEHVIETVYPYIWKKVTLAKTPQTTNPWYNGATDIIDLIRVNQAIGSTNDNIFNYGSAGYPVSVHFDQPTAVVASGVGIHIPYVRDTTNSINVIYRAKLTSTVSGGNYSDLDTGDADMIAYGVAARLVESRTIPRVSGQDNDQGDITVTPRSRLETGIYFRSRFIELRNQRNLELRQTIRPMGKWGR